MSDNIVLLVGTGQMAVEYSKVLKALKINYKVLGNSEKSCDSFHYITGIIPISGGYEGYLNSLEEEELPPYIVLAINDEKLSNALIEFCKKRSKKILCEKPGALTKDKLKEVYDVSQKTNTEIYIAYNRRKYRSVTEAKKIIDADGGVLSFHFDFTEWSHVIEKTKKPETVLKNWLIANSSHVIDLAFYLCGKPIRMECFVKGSLKWHTKGAIFTGAGITDKQALFSYHADWKSAGRWSIEINTKSYKLILRPLERLQIMRKGSIEIEQKDVDYSLDTKYKPGLYKQVVSFLEHEENLMTIKEQLQNFTYYESILFSKSI